MLKEDWLFIKLSAFCIQVFLLPIFAFYTLKEKRNTSWIEINYPKRYLHWLVVKKT